MQKLFRNKSDAPLRVVESARILGNRGRICHYNLDVSVDPSKSAHISVGEGGVEGWGRCGEGKGCTYLPDTSQTLTSPQ